MTATILIWLNFLGLIALYVAGIWNEYSTKRVGRLEYLKWFFMILIVDLAASLLADESISSALFCGLALFNIQITYPFAQVVARRCRDAGWSKKPAFWSAVPIIDIFILIIFLFKAPKSRATDLERST